MSAHANTGASGGMEEEQVDLLSAEGATTRDLSRPLATMQGSLNFIVQLEPI